MARWGRLVAGRPWTVIAVTVTVVVVIGTGLLRTEPTPDLVEALVPDRTDLADALDRIDERFPVSQRTTTAQIIVRGDVLDPAALTGLEGAVAAIVADPVVGPFVVDVVTHASAIADAAGVGVGELDRDTAVEVLGSPAATPILDLLVDDGAGGFDAAVGWMELRRGEGSGDEVLSAERRIGARLEQADLGPASARALTNAAFEDATDEAMDDSLVLFPVAIVLLVLVLLIGYRSSSDVVATFAAMVMVTVLTLGAEGWLGPAGLGLIGGATAIGVVVPVLLTGLTVDYALQVTSAYRGAMGGGATPAEAAGHAVATAGAAVALGALTTAASFLTNVASPLGPVRDFGVLAAIGIGTGLVVMTGFVPAWRTVVDPARGRHNRSLRRGELLSGVPVVSPALRAVIGACARRPLAVLAVAGVVFVGSILLATGVDVRFETDDFLPADSDFIEDLHFVENVVGGSDSTLSVVVVGDRRDPQVIGSLGRVESALAPGERPVWVVGDPRVLVDERDGDDTTLFVVPVRLGGTSERRAAIDFIEDLWVVDDGRLTVTGELVLPVVVADAVARGQLAATGIAVLAAFALLTTYFSRKHRRGVLGSVVIAPVVLVLALVLASMRVLDIPYNALTATLTALTIGLGVDYTIHVVHRYVAETGEGAAPSVALRRVAASTGGALVVSAATTVVGFGVLVLAPLPAVAQLGALTALTVSLSLLASVTVLPALLALVERWSQPRAPVRPPSARSPTATRSA